MSDNTSEVIFGTDGDDTLLGLGGHDTIYGLFGDDLINGGSGNDVIYGHSGNDTLNGGAGDDTLFSDQGIDRLFGGTGNDVISFGGAGLDSTAIANGGDGDDLIMISQTNGHRIYGGNGTDTLSVFWTELRHGGVSADFSGANPFVTSTSGNSLTFTGFEQFAVVSGNNNDTIIGGAMNDRFTVREGEDYVDAGAGDDFVSYSTRGAHTLEGGIGEDTLSVSASNSGLYFIIDGLNGHVDDGNLSVITGFEHYLAQGSSIGDVVAFAYGNDTFYGDNGEDTVFGGGGNDVIFGERGTDSLFGGDGRDRLLGGLAADILEGGDGDDTLNGGPGTDTMTGGAGHDRFVFYGMHGRFDLITDFTSGDDKIYYKLLGLTSGSPGLGRLEAQYLHVDAPQGSFAQFVLHYDSTSDQTSLLWDSNGDQEGGTAQDEILFTGNVSIAASDIFLF